VVEFRCDAMRCDRGPGGAGTHLEIDGEEEVRGGVLPEARAAEGGGDAGGVEGDGAVHGAELGL